MKIYGIPCHLRRPSSRAEARRVLRAIRQRRPADFERLRKAVRGIHPMDDDGEGTEGRWAPDNKPESDFDSDDKPGVIHLVEIEDTSHFGANLAHELGHAATREIDKDRRGAVYTNGLASELAADWYAYRWGFGRRIAQDRKTRNRLHHGPVPGSTFEVTDGGTNEVFTYRMTRNFCVRLIGKRYGRLEELGEIAKKLKGRVH